MKYLALLPAMLAAGPALAHDGLHLHPHGVEAIVTLIATVVMVVVARRGLH